MQTFLMRWVHNFGPGDETNTFNIPNMARRVPVGSGGQATPVLGNT